MKILLWERSVGRAKMSAKTSISRKYGFCHTAMKVIRDDSFKYGTSFKEWKLGLLFLHRKPLLCRVSLPSRAFSDEDTSTLSPFSSFNLFINAFRLRAQKHKTSRNTTQDDFVRLEYGELLVEPFV